MDTQLKETKSFIHMSPIGFSDAIGAADSNDIRRLQEYFKGGGRVNEQNKFGWTLLTHAVHKGSIDAVKFLCGQGENIDTVDHDGHSILYYGIIHGHENIVEFLIDEGAQVSKDEAMLAASKGLINVIQKFCVDHAGIGKENPVDVRDTRRDFAGWTFAIHATVQGHIDALCWLRKTARANLNALDVMGYSALYWGIHNNQEKAVRLLLGFGVVMDLAATLKAIKHDMAVVVQTYIDQNPSVVNEVNKAGRTLLMAAASDGRVGILRKLLVMEEIDVSTKNVKGLNALYFACLNGHVEVASLLIAEGSELEMPMVIQSERNVVMKLMQVYKQAGGELNVKDARGQTLLTWAAFDGKLDIAKFMIEDVGVDIDDQDNEGHSALQWASFAKRWELVDYLLSNGASDGLDIAITAAEEGRLSTVKAYLKAGGNPDYPDSDGFTLLMKAAMKGQNDILTWLLTKGNARLLTVHKQSGKTAVEYGYERSPSTFIEDFGLSTCDFEGNTLLHAACDTNFLPLINPLIEDKRAKLDVRNQKGFTGILVAARKGHIDTIKALVASGRTDISIGDIKGQNALQTACRWGRLKVVQYLLDEGYSADARRGSCTSGTMEEGNSCLLEACRWGWIDIVKYLVESCHLNPDQQNTDGDTAMHLASRYGHSDIVLYFLEQANKGFMNLSIENEKGITAVESLFINKIVTAIPQVLYMQANMPSRLALTQHYIQCSDPFLERISLRHINLMPTTTFLKAGKLLSYKTCVNENKLITGAEVYSSSNLLQLSPGSPRLLQKTNSSASLRHSIGSIGMNPGPQILFVSHRWACQSHPDPKNVQYNQICDFIKDMHKKHSTSFDYIWIDWSCVSDTEEEEMHSDHLRNICSIFFLATHCLVLPKIGENQSGDLTSDLAEFSERGWCQTEVLLALCTGCKVCICLQYNKDFTYIPLDPGPKMYGTSVFQAIKDLAALNHIGDSDTKYLFEHWGHAADPFFLLTETVMGLKKSGPESAQKAIHNNLEWSDFGDTSLLRVYHKLGNFQHEEDRLVVFRILISVVSFLLGYHKDSAQGQLHSYFLKAQMNLTPEMNGQNPAFKAAVGNMTQKLETVEAELSALQDKHFKRVADLTQKLQQEMLAKKMEENNCIRLQDDRDKYKVQYEKVFQQLNEVNRKLKQEQQKNAEHVQRIDACTRRRSTVSPLNVGGLIFRDEGALPWKGDSSSRPKTSKKADALVSSHRSSPPTDRTKNNSMSSSRSSLNNQQSHQPLNRRPSKSPQKLSRKAPLPVPTIKGLNETDSTSRSSDDASETQTGKPELPQIMENILSTQGNISTRMSVLHSKLDVVERASHHSPRTARRVSSAPLKSRPSLRSFWTSNGSLYSSGSSTRNSIAEATKSNADLAATYPGTSGTSNKKDESFPLVRDDSILTIALEDKFNRILDEKGFDAEEASNELLSLAGALDDQADSLQHRLQESRGRAKSIFEDESLNLESVLDENDFKSISGLVIKKGLYAENEVPSSFFPSIRKNLDISDVTMK